MFNQQEQDYLDASRRGLANFNKMIAGFPSSKVNEFIKRTRTPEYRDTMHSVNEQVSKFKQAMEEQDIFGHSITQI